MATFVEQTQANITENVAAVAEYRNYAAAHPGEQLADELLRCAAVIVVRLRARREVYIACGWNDVADMFTQALDLCETQPLAAVREP
jgi:hypothetical protein